MRIGFVGAGKVGFTLGKYMSERNMCVSGYYSAIETDAKEASEFTHTKYYTKLEDLAESSDALFLTVTDGAIADVWESLKRYTLSGKCICHCSGAMSSTVFSEIDQMGAFGYSIHPLFAIHSKYDSYREISNSYFTIEGSEKYLDYWVNTFRSFGNGVGVISAEQKVLYHAAAVFTSNLVVGLFEESMNLLMASGYDRESAGQALIPIFLNNCGNIARVGTTDALTGPVERCDLATIEKHLKVLPDHSREIYCRLSETLIDIAKRKHADLAENYELMAQVLERNGKNEEHGSNIQRC